jgi:type IV pilus assembly protein PilA
MLRNNNQGFTLIELLVVIGILGVLLAIVIVAINPAKQFAQANNTTRRSSVIALLNAVNQYSADNTGKLPTNMPAKGAESF